MYTPVRTAAEALNAIDPEVVLLDVRMRDYLAAPANPNDPRPAQMAAWLRDWAVFESVDDATHGRMDIYRRR